MKFSITLGLLFAGLASSQKLSPLEARPDAFLWETQHLKPTAKLVYAKQNGSFSTVTYQEGPKSVKCQVKTQNDQIKVVGIQQIVSFSSNLQSQPVSIQDVPQTPNELRVPPLPLIMPQLNMQSNGQVASRNVFEQVEQEMEEMERRMEQDRKNFHLVIEQKRLELQQRLRKNFNPTMKETPLLGAGNHDFNEATNIQIDQPLIRGDHDRNRATQMEDDHPIVGGSDHDYAWMTVQIEPIQPLLWANGHDFDPKFIPQGQLIGGGEHDNWVSAARQFNHPLIGGETDIDRQIGLQLVKPVSKDEVGKKFGFDLIQKANQMAKDIAEDEVQDIEEVEEPKTEAKEQKMQDLIK